MGKEIKFEMRKASDERKRLKWKESIESVMVGSLALVGRRPKIHCEKEKYKVHRVTRYYFETTGHTGNVTIMKIRWSGNSSLVFVCLICDEKFSFWNCILKTWMRIKRKHPNAWNGTMDVDVWMWIRTIGTILIW